jgi:ArsR family transcriptional regulator
LLQTFGKKEDFFLFACILPMQSLSEYNETGRSPFLRLKNISLSIGSQVFKALADESRLRIINLLLFKGDLSISDVETILDFTQTKTARLMGILKNAGLIQSKREDYWVFYRVKEEAADFLDNIISLMEKDQLLQKDRTACAAMESNRELSRQKIEQRRYKPSN